MRKFLHNFPLHTFLFIPFVSLFLFAQNPEHVTFSMMHRTLIVGICVSLLIFGIFYILFKSATRAGITTTFLLLILFNYGVFYDMIEYLYYASLWPFKNIHRYLIILVIVLSAIFILLVAKKINQGIRINYFLNVLIILLIIFNSAKIGLNSSVSNTPEITGYSENLVLSEDKLPNTYYIVLDGYANQNVLKEKYAFSNDAFIGALKKLGFYVADSAMSNYYSTVPSLCSSLNMNYLRMPEKERLSYLRDNQVFKLLKNNGYTIYNLRSGYSVTNALKNVDSTIAINTPNEFERSILKFTVFRLDDLFGFIQHKRLKSQFAKLPEVAFLKRNKRFVFVHIVAPHPPYVFDEFGNQLFNNKSQNNYWEPKESYINQLKFVNVRILDFIEKVIKNDPKSAIILQSDHGPWIQENDPVEVFNARAGILNAMRFPNPGKNFGYRSISSVNTFRLFFKTYFDSTFALLPDSAAGKQETLNSILFKERLE